MTTKVTGKDGIYILGGTTVAATDVISVHPHFEGKKSPAEGMGDDWDIFLTDLTKGGGFTINGYWTGTGAAEATSLRKAIEDIWAQDDHKDTFTLRPSGTGSPLVTMTGTAILDDWDPTWDKAETALVSANFTFDGAVTITTQ